MMPRYYILWQDEGTAPEVLDEIGCHTSEESEKRAKAFVQSDAYEPQEDTLYELVVEDGRAWVNAFSNGQVDEWYAEAHKGQS